LYFDGSVGRGDQDSQFAGSEGHGDCLQQWSGYVLPT